MTVRPGILILLAGAALALPVAVSAHRLRAARLDLAHREDRAAETARLVDRLISLRATEQRVAERPRPEQDLIARVNAVLARAGLAERSFGALSLVSDSALGAPATTGGLAYRRQSVRVTLSQLTLPQIGSFLAAWDEAQPLWTPTRIDLTHPQARDQRARDRYDATILVAATYVADEATALAPASGPRPRPRKGTS